MCCVDFGSPLRMMVLDIQPGTTRSNVLPSFAYASRRKTIRLNSGELVSCAAFAHDPILTRSQRRFVCGAVDGDSPLLIEERWVLIDAHGSLDCERAGGIAAFHCLTQRNSAGL